MPRTKISEFSATPANNTDIDSINIAEGCAPSGINDAIRELMSQLKDFQTGAVGDSFNGPVGTSTAAAGAFTTLSASSTLGVTGVATLGAGAILNTPASVTLTNATGLPIGTGVSGLGTGVATFLATPSSANLRSALTDETGTGSAVFATSPTLVTPLLGTPTSGVATNLTGLPLTTGVTGTLPTANGGTGLTSFTSGGVVYASSSSALATGSALTFDGTNLSVGTTALSGGKFSALADLTAVNGLVVRDSATTYANNDNYVLLQNSTGVTVGGLTHPAANSLGIWGNDDIRFFQSGSATEQMRLTSTGLLVGTTSNPNSSKLMVGGTVQVKPATNNSLEIFGPNSGTGIRLFARNDAGTLNRLELQGGQVIFPLTTGADGMYFDASAGNLGLGVTPSAWSSSYKAFQFGNSGAIWSNATGNTEAAFTTNVYFDGSYRYKNTAAATNYTQFAGQHQWYTAASGTAGNAISFTQAATLTAGGNFHIARTTTADTTVGASLFADGTITCARSASDNGNLNLYVYSTGAGAARFYVGMGGTVYATSTTITAISDQRLKENIRDLDDGLDVVMALKPRKFDWKTGKGKDIKNDRGFIAQEFENVLPDMIENWADPAPEGQEAYKAVNANLIPTLVKAIQELNAKFEAYKATHP